MISLRFLWISIGNLWVCIGLNESFIVYYEIKKHNFLIAKVKFLFIAVVVFFFTNFDNQLFIVTEAATHYLKF